ncbi:hypothetical protein ACFL6Y_03825 [Elusimicrobiota bacterium]
MTCSIIFLLGAAIFLAYLAVCSNAYALDAVEVSNVFDNPASASTPTPVSALPEPLNESSEPEQFGGVRSERDRLINSILDSRQVEYDGDNGDVRHNVRDILSGMLSDLDMETLQNIENNDDFTVYVIPASMDLTDLPDFASYKGKKRPSGKPYEDVRGIMFFNETGSQIVASEENLVSGRIPGAKHRNMHKYRGATLIHELAHLVWHRLLRTKRTPIANNFTKRRDNSQAFPGYHSKKNASEYFAVSTAMFFEASDYDGTNGPDWLRENDIFMYNSLVDIFGQPKNLSLGIDFSAVTGSY